MTMKEWLRRPVRAHEREVVKLARARAFEICQLTKTKVSIEWVDKKGRGGFWVTADPIKDGTIRIKADRFVTRTFAKTQGWTW